MTKTLDEFFQSYGATKFLVKNLKTNLKVLGDSLSNEEKESLMIVNLIMIRQCLNDFGVE